MRAVIKVILGLLAVCGQSFVPVSHSVSMPQRRRESTIVMGKLAKFGIFSPAVYGARIVLGDKRLEKLRGKAIGLHSQAITEFCLFVGATPKTRGLLIKKAKTNGDTLGFLV
mmetsp:Transcript_22030/g.34002  ORF Transcript_22030/g.34002 Transcript_22030/m.34002 type:complete len:112 (-) Transcript_22030:2853-3188(-)